tara:strand:+ start:43929 stop:44468 length:540 start_codon:yes stop_codon:yes gene_type:complete
MNLAEAKALLPEIRIVLELASQQWTDQYSLENGRGQICGQDPMTGEVYPIATLEKSIGSDDRQLMRKAPVYVRALLLLRDEAVRAYKEATQPPAEPPKKAEPKPLSTIAVGKCAADRAFVRYLMERHGLEDASNTERVKTKVRSVLAIQSFKELNDDPRAIQAWQHLVRNFKAWLKVPQ